ncbi:MAG: hypothetical protein M2R45_00986 [Verrucomicrobia subdivision 3 bacterium]|nr:hypothetical protein [Limisphaerales bacterium]MCS1414653.1 hypothetical protein [Limisphaerales bacterium]
MVCLIIFGLCDYVLGSRILEGGLQRRAALLEYLENRALTFI